MTKVRRMTTPSIRRFIWLPDLLPYVVLLCRPRRAQDVAHGVIPLVTGVLEHLLRAIDVRQRHGIGPWPRPHRGVFEGDAPLERVRRHWREPLDHADVLAAALRCAVGPEVRRLDDERVAVPPAAGIAHVVATGLGRAAWRARGGASA